MDNVPLIIADGDIPTTHILAGALKQAFGDVEVRASENLFGATVDGRCVVVSRLCHPSFGWLPEYLADRNVSYAYFIDDNFWELTADVDVHLAEFYQNPAVTKTLDAFVGGAARVIVMSRRLGDYIRRRHPRAVIEYVVPGFDVDCVRALSASVTADAKPANEIRIGYPTTRRANVSALLVPVVETIVARHRGRVRFEFVGWAPDAVLRREGVDLHPFVDGYQRYLELMVRRRWDIGIAPLAQGSFEMYKTQVKYREYGGLGIAGIYSRVAPYVDYVIDGATGLLVENTAHAWISAIDRLIDDAALRAAIARNALADVQQNFNSNATARQLSALLRRRDEPVVA